MTSLPDPPTAQRSGRRRGESRVVAEPIPMGVLTNPAEPDLGQKGVSLTSISAPQPILFARTDCPLLWLLDR